MNFSLILLPLNNKLFNFLAYAGALLFIYRVVYFLPKMENEYYLFAFILLFLCILQRGLTHCSLNMPILALCVVCMVSIVYNEIPAFFKAPERLSGMILLLLLLSPLIHSPFLDRFRLMLYQHIQWLYLGIVIVSIISIPGQFSQYSAPYWGGITVHSMTLGPVVGITILNLLYIGLRAPRKLKLSLRIKVTLFFCIILLMGSGSRIAFSATLLAGTYFIFRLLKGKIIRLACGIGVCACLSSSIWMPYFEVILAKNKGDVTNISMDSRTHLWQDRLEEFAQSPLYGIGFSCVDNLNSYSIETGAVEPGSSWLTILSMTGLGGMCCFLWLMGCMIRQIHAITKIDFVLGVYFYALLIFWSVEFIAEGVLFASGATEFVMFWLLCGVISANYYNRNSYVNSTRDLSQPVIETVRCTSCQSEGTLESSLPSDVRRDRHNSKTTIQHA